MTITTLRKLLGTANILGGIGVLVLLLYVVRQSSALPPVHRKIQLGDIATTRPSEKKPRAAREYRDCWMKGIPQPVASEGPARTSGVSSIALNRYKFYSAIIMPGSEPNFASIADGSNRQLYAEREKVGEFVLAQVFFDKVILEKGGQSFTLDRTDSPAVSARVPRGRSTSRRTVSPGGSPPARGAARRRGSIVNPQNPEDMNPANRASGRSAPEHTGPKKHVIIPSKDKDYILENFPKILHDVKIQTELEEDGSMSGIRIGSIKAGSILARTGKLRTGDIIRSVNGTPVNSVPQAVLLYETLSKRNVKTVNVTIERDGKVFTNTYNITDTKR